MSALSLRERHAATPVLTLLVYPMPGRPRRPREEAGELLAVTFFVGGCRFARRVLQPLKRSGVMEQSSTYQAVLREGEKKGRVEGRAEGRAEGESIALRRSILALARNRLGAVPTRLERRLERLDAAALDDLFTKLLEADTPAEIRKLLPR